MGKDKDFKNTKKDYRYDPRKISETQEGVVKYFGRELDNLLANKKPKLLKKFSVIEEVYDEQEQSQELYPSSGVVAQKFMRPQYSPGPEEDPIDGIDASPIMGEFERQESIGMPPSGVVAQEPMRPQYSPGLEEDPVDGINASPIMGEFERQESIGMPPSGVVAQEPMRPQYSPGPEEDPVDGIDASPIMGEFERQESPCFPPSGVVAKEFMRHDSFSSSVGDPILDVTPQLPIIEVGDSPTGYNE